jgi:transposase
LGAKGERVVD